MHTKSEEKIVWGIFIFGIVIILIYYLKSGITIDNILLVLKDSVPLILTIFLFRIVSGIKDSKSYEKAAEKAIKRICQNSKQYHLKDSDTKNGKKTGRYLYLVNNEISFIPIAPLLNGFLEIRISFGTLDAFGYSINQHDSDKDDKITKVQNTVKENVIKMLREKGARFHEDVTKNKEKNIAVRVEFDSTENYQLAIEAVVDNIVTLLKKKQGL